MREAGRKDYGMTPKGAVVVIAFEGSPGNDGEMEEHRYEVRHGVRTVGEFTSEADARAVAKALTADV